MVLLLLRKVVLLQYSLCMWLPCRKIKTDKYLKGIMTLTNRIKINCKAGVVTTNQMGSYGNLKVWYLPEGIANIFLMHELEKLYRITYDSWMGITWCTPPREQ
jgi:hypothetical protein